MKPSTQESATDPGTSNAEVPHAPHFDKLKTMKTLQAAAFSEDQAGAMIEAIDGAQHHLATKSDMGKMEYVLRTDIEKMESGIRADMEKMGSGIRADMEKMGLCLRTDMEKMELRLRADMQAELRRLYWYIPLVIGVAASLLGAFSSA